jgi:hypothetical protein
LLAAFTAAFWLHVEHALRQHRARRGVGGLEHVALVRQQEAAQLAELAGGRAPFALVLLPPREHGQVGEARRSFRGHILSPFRVAAPPPRGVLPVVWAGDAAPFLTLELNGASVSARDRARRYR